MLSRNFFISGGTGLIGRALIRRLLGLTTQRDVTAITLLTRDSKKFSTVAPDIASHPAIHLLQGDLTHVTLPDSTYTDIIHAATDTNDLLVKDTSNYYWNIVSGTKRMLDFAKQSGCQRFLYLSSGAVYGAGEYPDSGTPENWPNAPSLGDEKSTYGQAKRASEFMCTLAEKNSAMAVRIARIFALVGDEIPLDGQYALGNFLREALDPKSASITVNGDGTPIRSYMHVDDVAHWLLEIHERAEKLDVLNVGSEIKINIRELAELVACNAPVKKPVVVMQKTNDYAGRSIYVPDCSHARTSLGLSQTIDLSTSIRQLVEKYSADK